MKALLPWYLNNTLDPADRRQVERWLDAQPDREDLLATCQQVREAVQSQPVLAAPAAVEARLRATLRAAPAQEKREIKTARWPWAFGFLLTVVVLFGLWFVFQPGVVLEWSAGETSVETYQVYRATAGSGAFELLVEVTPGEVQDQYSYVDLALWPGQTYSYRVIGIVAGGVAANSPVVTGETWTLIQTQLAILAISLLAGYGGIVLARQWRPSQRLEIPAFG